MSIFELTVDTVLFNQQCSNVFHYAPDFELALEGYAANLIVEFSNVVLAELALMMSTNVDLVRLYCRDIYNDAEFAEVVYSPPIDFGLSDNPALPTFVALAFRSTRQAVGVNRWYKRFAGVPENQVTGDTWNGAASFGADIATALGTTLAPSGTIGEVSMAPALLRKQAYTTPAGNTGYRYFTTESAQRDNIWFLDDADISFYRLTTQRSRLAGVGV